MLGCMKLGMSNLNGNKISKSVVLKSVFISPLGKLNAKEIPFSQKSTGMVHAEFKHIILRIYRHTPPQGQCFSKYGLWPISGPWHQFSGSCPTCKENEDKKEWKDWKWKEEGKGRGKRGHGKYYFLTLFFFFYLWGMCVCVCILGQNVKCSFEGALSQNNEEKNTLRVRGPLTQMIKEEIAILLGCQYV